MSHIRRLALILCTLALVLGPASRTAFAQQRNPEFQETNVDNVSSLITSSTKPVLLFYYDRADRTAPAQRRLILNTVQALTEEMDLYQLDIHDIAPRDYSSLTVYGFDKQGQRHSSKTLQGPFNSYSKFAIKMLIFQALQELDYSRIQNNPDLSSRKQSWVNSPNPPNKSGISKGN